MKITQYLIRLLSLNTDKLLYVGFSKCIPERYYYNADLVPGSFTLQALRITVSLVKHIYIYTYI